ncbi:hypothetical protein NEIRO03_0001 [Nematocida sp. AWRm78]|nr:hypothetical protein NEIRO02_0013 [Nematocida sp. AWRm79]KAI5182317.1 hypothetical protein NEIRO03_0001 [Nematocida sp. AWRm78]
MFRAERITKLITEKFPSAKVKITDRTKEHSGHREMISKDDPQETHLDISVCDASFEGKPIINSIREINRLIKNEFTQGLHAVTISCTYNDK